MAKQGLHLKRWIQRIRPNIMFWPYIQTDFTLIKIKIILNIYIYFCVMDTKTKYEGEYTMSVLDLFVSKFFCFF